MQVKPQRIISVDIIRVLAMLMVICLHTINDFTLRPDFFATKVWFVFEPFVALSRIGVALFFMISGFLVITKDRSIRENWHITRDRVLTPLICFSLLNLGYKAYRFSLTHQGFSVFWKEQITQITNFPNSSFWFLFVLLFLYLLNPVWQIIFAKEHKKLAQYVTVLSLIFSIFVTFIKFLNPSHTIFFNGFTLWLGYLFFYFYGGLVKQGWVNTKQHVTNLIFVLVGLLAIIAGDYYTYATTIHGQSFLWSGYFFESLSIPLVLASIGTFNLLIFARFKWLTRGVIANKVTALVATTASLSYGVYLIHPFVVSILLDEVGFYFDKLSINVYLYNILNYFLVVGISAGITYVVLRIPLLNTMLGKQAKSNIL